MIATYGLQNDVRSASNPRTSFLISGCYPSSCARVDETPQTIRGPAVTNLGFGAIYQLSKHWALMASGGPGLEAVSRSEASAFYASLQFTN